MSNERLIARCKYDLEGLKGRLRALQNQAPKWDIAAKFFNGAQERSLESQIQDKEKVIARLEAEDEREKKKQK